MEPLQPLRIANIGLASRHVLGIAGVDKKHSEPTCIEKLENRYTKPEPGHKIYPYLLRDLEITRPNQVWAMDITYIPMARGFIYLAVVLDWFSRRILAWRLSITMEVSFCVAALEDALAHHGKPAIVNTDQGSQFTGSAFTGVLTKQSIAISMEWQRRLAGQCVRRAVVAHHQIRGGIFASL